MGLHGDGVSATDLHEGQLREPPEVPGQDARRAVAGLGENVHQRLHDRKLGQGQEQLRFNLPVDDCLLQHINICNIMLMSFNCMSPAKAIKIKTSRLDKYRPRVATHVGLSIEVSAMVW